MVSVAPQEQRAYPLAGCGVGFTGGVVGCGVEGGSAGRLMQGSFTDRVGTGVGAEGVFCFLRHDTLDGIISVSCSTALAFTAHGVWIAAIAVCGRMLSVIANAAHTVKPMIFLFIMDCHHPFDGNNTPKRRTKEPPFHRQFGAFPTQRLQSLL